MRKTVAFLLLAVLWLAACSRQTGTALMPQGNATYYWRTTFALDSAEKDFLRRYHIGRIYCRYFDVVPSASPVIAEGQAPVGSQPVPNATIAFQEPFPEGVEVVPTVFVLEQCMRPYPDSLARRIVRRIVQMNETHDIANVGEIQIDCDYTVRSRDNYYHFLREVRSEARAHGLTLSTTIRLHQLAMPAPPADYGVLMLYNTGAPDNFAERNPILDIRDVQPYVRHLKGFPLPLAAAYPVFLWQRTLHGVNIDHVAPVSEILRTKQAVEKQRDDLRRLILTYYLDNENIKRYTNEEYEEIYRH